MSGHASIIPWIRNMYLDIMVMKYIIRLDENIKFVMILKKKKVRAHLNWSRQLLRIKWYLATLVVCYIALSLYIILRLGKNLHSTHLDPIRLTISLCINTSVNTITLSLLLLLLVLLQMLSSYYHFVCAEWPLSNPSNPPKLLAITHMWNVTLYRYTCIYAWHLCVSF